MDSNKYNILIIKLPDLCEMHLTSQKSGVKKSGGKKIISWDPLPKVYIFF